jgi:heme/copper-type cytochrome/quinol oxidase subunit 3
VLQYSLEVLFVTAVVLLMCSASSEWAPFSFEKKKKWDLANGMVVASL